MNGNYQVRRAKVIRDEIMSAFKRLDRLEDGETLRRLMDQYVADALNGDKETRKDLLDRLFGKPVQATELSGPEGNSLVISWPLPKSPLDN